jgi:hypothetical protein
MEKARAIHTARPRRKHNDKISNTFTAETLGQGSKQRASSQSDSSLCEQGAKWIMYGRKGNHPTLDNFKQNNGCVKFELTRYYVLLTRKGKIAT